MLAETERTPSTAAPDSEATAAAALQQAETPLADWSGKLIDDLAGPDFIAKTVEMAAANARRRIAETDGTDWMARLTLRNSLCDLINMLASVMDPSEEEHLKLKPIEDIFDSLTASIDNAAGPGSHEAKVALAHRLDQEGFDVTDRLTQLELAAEQDFWPKVTRRFEEERDRLINAIMEPRSAALQRAIQRAADLKIALVDVHVAGGYQPTEEQDAAWTEGRAKLVDAAYELAVAPIASASDALIRAEAFIDACGRDRETNLTEDDNGDLRQLVESYRLALEWIASREPEREEWDQTVSDLQKIDTDLSVLLATEESYAKAALVDDGLKEETATKISALYDRRDDARVKVLGMMPPDVGGLLVQLEIICDHAGLGDLRTYSSRALNLGETPINARELWNPTEKDTRKGIALVANNAAKLRDAYITEDWCNVVDAAKSPEAKDAVHFAFSSRLCAADVHAVHFQPALPKNKPFILIYPPDGKILMAQADGVWEWRPLV